EPLVRFPRYRRRRSAHPEHGGEQQLDAAAPRPHDQVRSADGAGEALPYAEPHVLDSDEQCHAQTDREYGERRGEQAVPQRLGGEERGQHRHVSPHPSRVDAEACTRFSSGRESERPKRDSRCRSWLTKRSVEPASPQISKSSSRKWARRSASSEEVGSSATTSSGAPISARAAATLCCWPTLSSVTG